MAGPGARLMSAGEFYRWQLDQDERYELVDGVSVPLHGMTGASNAHDTIVVNCIAEHANRLRGKPCRVATADTALRVKIRTTRRPDVTVDCAAPDPYSHEARNPVVVVEVLSPSTRKFDQFTKLDEFRRHPTLRHILPVDPDAISAKLYSRPDGGEWSDEDLTGAGAAIIFTEIDISLPLGALYDRLNIAS